jgi:pilus assembly protein CpaB
MIIRMIMAGVLVLAAGGLGIAFLASRPPAPAPVPVATEEAPRPEPEVVAPVAKKPMLVAARPLSAGTLVKDEDFVVREVAPDAVPEGALLESEEVRVELRGALLRRYLDAGAVVARGDVLRPRDRGFLAAVLRPGSRAIAVGVDAVTGAAGLIWPGDQVDLILTQEMDASAAPVSRRIVGETVLTNVRVIAVDQHFTQGASAGLMATGGNNQRSVARTVTLEVAPEQAERVAVAERLGKLSLAVRSMEQSAENTPSDAAPTSVFGADVSPALSRTGHAVGSRIRVIQGGESREVTFR